MNTELPNEVLSYVAEVETRADRASFGPWTDDNGYRVRDDDGNIVAETKHCEGANRYDSTFIANAREDVPRLCRIVREQAASLDECGRLLGQVVCAGTLAPGESLVEPFGHAAVAAILDEIRQRNEVMAERDALRKPIDGKTAEWMRAQSACDSEKESHRRTISELGLVRDRLSKLETAARFAYDAILASSVCDEPCECIDCQILETLGEALDIPRIGET